MPTESVDQNGEVIVMRHYGDRTEVPTRCREASRTKQEFKDECDINRLMARYQKTGNLSHIAGELAQYGDFTQIADFHTALNQVIEAESAFASLPAEVRDRFRNQPANLLRFLEDPANTDEAVQLGLAERSTDPETPTLPPVVETPPAPEVAD